MIRLKKTAYVVIAICLIMPYAWADTSVVNDVECSSSQTLIPGVCPANPEPLPMEASSPIKSEPILLPAQKPDIAILHNADTVVTPAPSSRKIKRTLVPGITPATVPEAMKKPITLQQALQIAFQNSPDIQTALSQVEASRGTVDQAKAQFNPTFNLQASYTRQGPVTATEFPGGGAVQAISSSTTTTKLQIMLPLDISHQYRYSSDIATYQFQIQYLSMVSVSQQLILSVKSAYYDLLRACGQKAVAQAAVDSAKARLENIQAKRQEGTVPQFDVTSAEVELENLNQELIAAGNNVSVAQSSFNGVLGVNVNNPTQLISSNVPVTVDCIDIPKSVDEAYARRPELKAAQTQVTVSKTNVSLQKSSNLPSLSLSGGPSYDFNAANTSNYSWQANATLNIPIWDGGITKSRVRQARAEAQTSISTLDQIKIAVAKEVRKASLDLQEAALRTKTTAHAVSLAEDALSIANDRYDAGIAVLVEVTNAQSQLTQARFNYVNAQYDYAIALAQLQRSISCQPELNQLQLLAGQGEAKKNEKEAQS